MQLAIYDTGETVTMTDQPPAPAPAPSPWERFRDWLSRNISLATLLTILVAMVGSATATIATTVWTAANISSTLTSTITPLAQSVGRLEGRFEESTKNTEKTLDRIEGILFRDVLLKAAVPTLSPPPAPSPPREKDDGAEYLPQRQDMPVHAVFNAQVAVCLRPEGVLQIAYLANPDWTATYQGLVIPETIRQGNIVKAGAPLGTVPYLGPTTRPLHFTLKHREHLLKPNWYLPTLLKKQSLAGNGSDRF